MASYEYAYVMDEFFGTGILTALLSGIPSGLIGIGSYILTALALYTAAQRRGLNRPWLAWIPVVNCWIIGSLSDQYRYVVKDEIRSKRKILLVLNILLAVLTAAVAAIAVVLAFGAIGGVMRGFGETRMMETVLGPVVGILGLSLPLAGLAIAFAVVRYMALYDIYRSMDPANCVLFLVLSILFGITEPFFLFFNRNKDFGMPPRKQEPAYARQEPVYQQEAWWEDQPFQYQASQTAPEPWENDGKDYL